MELDRSTSDTESRQLDTCSQYSQHSQCSQPQSQSVSGPPVMQIPPGPGRQVAICMYLPMCIIFWCMCKNYLLSQGGGEDAARGIAAAPVGAPVQPPELNGEEQPHVNQNVCKYCVFSRS